MRILNFFSSLILFILKKFSVVASGYKKENGYSNTFNDRIKKLEDNFNYWDDEKDREIKHIKISKEIKNIIYQEENHQYSEKILLFKRSGFTNFEDLNLNNDEIQEIYKYINDKRIYLNHTVPFSKYSTKNFKIAKFFSRYGSYSLFDILNCNKIFEIINNNKLYNFVSEYFGCPATISNVNLYWTFPKIGDQYLRTRVSRFHRDVEDYKTAILFINLTDTKEDDGAHAYIEGSNNKDFLDQNLTIQELNEFKKKINEKKNLPDGYYNADEFINFKFGKKAKIFYGKKGSAIVTDNFGLHRAISPKSKPRLVLWLTFSLTQSSNINSFKLSKIYPQERYPYSQIRSKLKKNLITQNLYKNLVNFDL